MAAVIGDGDAAGDDAGGGGRVCELPENGSSGAEFGGDGFGSGFDDGTGDIDVAVGVGRDSAEDVHGASGTGEPGRPFAFASVGEGDDAKVVAGAAGVCGEAGVDVVAEESEAGDISIEVAGIEGLELPGDGPGCGVEAHDGGAEGRALNVFGAADNGVSIGKSGDRTGAVAGGVGGSSGEGDPAFVTAGVVADDGLFGAAIGDVGVADDGNVAVRGDAEGLGAAVTGGVIAPGFLPEDVSGVAPFDGEEAFATVGAAAAGLYDAAIGGDGDLEGIGLVGCGEDFLPNLGAGGSAEADEGEIRAAVGGG